MPTTGLKTLRKQETKQGKGEREMQIVEVKLSDIKPYENNPRNNEGAVDAVAESISQFGFKVPIVLDKDNVIITGHTRYKAAKAMSYEKVPCIYADDLTEDQIKKFRLVDNKVGEIATWDFEKLETELNELDFSGYDFGLDLFESFTGEDTETGEDEFEKQKKVFEERMKRGEISEEDEEYQEFLEKFELKKTTDDCYTPEKVYNAVLQFCIEEYGIDKKKVVRPFYPGGDYVHEKYPKDAVVVDNPPFSILSEIVRYYYENKIKFFLFAPALTLFSSSSSCTAVCVGAQVIYENKANVSTSFLTNLENTEIRCKTSPKLYRMLDEAIKATLAEMRREIPKYEYPDNVITSTKMSYFCKYGQELTIKRESSLNIDALDSQKEKKKTIFGKGYLISEKAAAEKAAANKWELSDREKELIKGLK